MSGITTYRVVITLEGVINHVEDEKCVSNACHIAEEAFLDNVPGFVSATHKISFESESAKDRRQVA